MKERLSDYKKEYIEILSTVSDLLYNNDSLFQKKIIDRLILNIKDNQFDDFKVEINSINLLGGSGVVWEVSFKDEDLNSLFEKNIIELINLLEKSQKLKRGVNSIRNRFSSIKNTSVNWLPNSVKIIERSR